MAFVLKSHRAPGKRVVKLLLRELDEALAALAHQPFAGEEVHTVRRCGKRSRALLRLVREALPPHHYERENLCWREVGQALGPVRDAEVLGDTVVRLRQRYATLLPAATSAAARQRFGQQQAQALRVAKGCVPRLVTALTAARKRMSRWRPAPDWNVILDGFADSHRKGRRACRDARRHPDPGHRHEWRKRVKDLLYQTGLLEPLRPRPMHACERAWGKLADRLGQEHDVHELLTQLPAAGDQQSGDDRFMQLAKRWAASLQRKADDLGSRLHAQRAGPLMKRLRHYARSAGTK